MRLLGVWRMMGGRLRWGGENGNEFIIEDYGIE